MRLASRILVVAALAVGPAVVALLGCGVDTAGNLPGLPNEIPNIPGGGVGSVSGNASTSTSSGTTTAALSPCDCAASLVVAGACSTCVNGTETGACQSQFAACSGTCSSTAAQCFLPCDGGSACINNCLISTVSLAYEALLLCQCNACQTVCGQPTPLSCEINLDGGLADAPADG